MAESPLSGPGEGRWVVHIAVHARVLGAGPVCMAVGAPRTDRERGRGGVEKIVKVIGMTAQSC